ncbi:hypothetical protein ACVWZ6_008440 [Bradyrhizobium sp. GM6.1]
MFFSRISFKLVLIVGISLLGMIALAPIALSTLRAQMIADRQAKTQHLVDVGYGILAHYQKLESEGKLPREQAQAGAIAEIKSLRYDKVEYFWLNDMTPKMVMHPIKPELDGKDLSGMKDPSGNALFVGFVDVVKKQGAGFYSYLWPKPGFDQPVGKISYVKGFAPWGWIIGTGIYLDDVDAVFRQNAMTFALVCLVVFVLVLGASFVIGRSVTRPLGEDHGTDRPPRRRRQRVRRAPYRSSRRDRRARQGARRVQGQCVGGRPHARRTAGDEAEGRRGEAQDDDRPRRQVRSERSSRRPRRVQGGARDAAGRAGHVRDRRQGDRPCEPRRHRLPAGLEQRADGGLRRRAAVVLDRRDQPARRAGCKRGRQGRRRRSTHQRHRARDLLQPRTRSARSSTSSTRSPRRPICSRSTPPSRRRAPARPARVLQWWQAK